MNIKKCQVKKGEHLYPMSGILKAIETDISLAIIRTWGGDRDEGQMDQNISLG